MSNITHAVRSEDYLYGIDAKADDGKVSVDHIESAAVHAVLAVATAVREMTESLHADVRRNVERKNVPPVMLSNFNAVGGDPVLLNVLAVTAVVPESESVTRVDCGAQSYMLAGNFHIIGADIFRAVGSW